MLSLANNPTVTLHSYVYLFSSYPANGCYSYSMCIYHMKDHGQVKVFLFMLYIRGGGEDGAAATVKKIMVGLSPPPKNYLEPSSIIRHTVIEQPRSRYSNGAFTVFLEEQCSKLSM